ncbi:hypothetical protein ACPRR3_05265 [Enterobacter asburiae]|uniref:hypothetical protein n=1 Tax=Enterobacteriaceae TaxID=543 RepID=UPI001D0CB016|nr:MULTISPECIES: hypothetical protein [Enterobacteriaceae]MDC6393819.1 hypothetical protein [Enterobacter asburiae]MDC6400013.1 hypothetical protein [Enterobacter asburiae]MDG9839531.1 hypothetical protein [Enterobacter asburiae]
MAQLSSDRADKQVAQRIQMRRKELGITAQHLAELVKTTIAIRARNKQDQRGASGEYRHYT